MLFFLLLLSSSLAQSPDEGYDEALFKPYSVTPTGYSKWSFAALNGDFVPVGVSGPEDTGFLTSARLEDMYGMPPSLMFNASEVVVTIDLGYATSVSSAGLKGRCCRTGAARPSSIEVLSSADGSNWVSRSQQSLSQASTSPIDKYVVKLTFASAVQRYWRLVLQAPASTFVQFTNVHLWS